jgi:hypothetical protein
MARSFDPADVLAMPLVAILATDGGEGPRTSPVWFIWENGALWMLGDREGSSVRRLTADPACAVEIVHLDLQAGVLLHLGFRGQTEVTPNDPARFRRLLARYLGPDPADWNPWFLETVARVEDPSGRFIRLVPETTFTNNVSYFRTGPALAWPPASAASG